MAKTISPMQTMLMGAYAGLPVLEPTPFLDLFRNKPNFVSSTLELAFDVKINKQTAASLVEKGAKGKGSITPNTWVRKKVTPGDIYDEDSLSATELAQMQAGETEVFLIGGKPIKTGQQLAEMKLQRIKNSIEKRKNIMCTQLINDGKIYDSYGNVMLDYEIPAADTMTYNGSTVFLAEFSKKIAAFRKRTGLMPDRSLIGADIVEKMLGDTLVQDTMYKLGYTNIAQNLTVNEKALVIGTFMGQTLEQMDLSFDAKGVEIIPGNVIKLLATDQLRNGYTAIEVVKDINMAPELWNGDIWTDIENMSKSVAKAKIFARSGYFPIVVDSQAIYTINVTIA